MDLYDVDERALSYYKNIVSNYNRFTDITINADVLIRRLTAMTNVGNRYPCENKENLYKVYCMGYKLTVDVKKNLIKYLDLSIAGNTNYKKVKVSCKPEMVEKLKTEYQRLGLNSFGLLTDIHKQNTNIKTTSQAEIFRDIRHLCEKQCIEDCMIALNLLQRLYIGRDSESSGFNSYYLTKTEEDISDIKRYCEVNLVTDPLEALELCKKLYNLTNKRRLKINKKREEQGKEKPTVYFTRILKEELGKELVWQ